MRLFGAELTLFNKNQKALAFLSMFLIFEWSQRFHKLADEIARKLCYSHDSQTHTHTDFI